MTSAFRAGSVFLVDWRFATHFSSTPSSTPAHLRTAIQSPVGMPVRFVQDTDSAAPVFHSMRSTSTIRATRSQHIFVLSNLSLACAEKPPSAPYVASCTQAPYAQTCRSRGECAGEFCSNSRVRRKCERPIEFEVRAPGRYFCAWDGIGSNVTARKSSWSPAESIASVVCPLYPRCCLFSPNRGSSTQGRRTFNIALNYPPSRILRRSALSQALFSR